MLDEGKQRGVKVSIIDYMDFDDWMKIGKAIQKLGYKVEVGDNGVAICNPIPKTRAKGE